MMKSILFGGREVKKITINGGTFFEKQIEPTESYRHIRVGDDLKGRTLYFGEWDGTQWLSRGFDGKPFTATSGTQPVIRMPSPPTSYNRVARYTSSALNTSIAVRINGTNVNVYQGVSGRPLQNMLEYQLPDFGGTPSIVSEIDENDDCYQYIYIKEEKRPVTDLTINSRMSFSFDTSGTLPSIPGNDNGGLALGVSTINDYQLIRRYESGNAYLIPIPDGFNSVKVTTNDTNITEYKFSVLNISGNNYTGITNTSYTSSNTHSWTSGNYIAISCIYSRDGALKPDTDYKGKITVSFEK